jgi:hypothetical protein
MPIVSIDIPITLPFHRVSNTLETSLLECDRKMNRYIDMIAYSKKPHFEQVVAYSMLYISALFYTGEHVSTNISMHLNSLCEHIKYHVM